jgi:predicted small lipoprotein YifL
MNSTTGSGRSLRQAGASLLAALALCALAGCGQKGPLIRPDQPPTAVPATPAAGQASKDKDTDQKQP